MSLYCRCWVVVDDQLRVINQKKAPKLATVFQSVEEKDGSYTLVLTAPGYGEIRIPQPDKTTPYTSIRYNRKHEGNIVIKLMDHFIIILHYGIIV